MSCKSTPNFTFIREKVGVIFWNDIAEIVYAVAMFYNIGGCSHGKSVLPVLFTREGPNITC